MKLRYFILFLGPADFNTNSAIMGAFDSSVTWYEQTTAIGGGMTLGAQQLDTNDQVPDAMIVITDGWDGDLSGKLPENVLNLITDHSPITPPYPPNVNSNLHDRIILTRKD